MPVATTSSSPDRWDEEFPEIPRPGGLWPWLLAAFVLAAWGTYLVVTPGGPPEPSYRTSVLPVRPVAVASSRTPVPAGARLLELGIVDSQNSTFTIAAESFARKVANRTHGRVQVRILPGQTRRNLGELELVQQVAAGELEMTFCTTSPLSNLNSSFDVLDLPFLFHTLEQADQVLDGPIGRGLFAGLETHNLKGLGYLELGFRIFSCGVPMPDAESFKGKRIRVLESATCIRMARAFGSTPVPAPVDKIYEMGKQGLIDAADRTYPTYWDFQLYDVQRYITETQHTYSAKVILINRQVFDSLDPDDQEALLQAAREVEMEQRLRQREEEKRVRERCSERKITIYTMDADQRKAFVDLCQPMFEEYKRMRDPKLLEQIQATPGG
ncbi:TRAP transporter substrate-binding protein [bacterium CPR1]|nr:TRAP transporter substrate-binding protein [bacterium CPR1]